MPPKVHRLVRVAHTEQPIADPPHRLVALSLRGNSERERHRQIGKPSIWHEQMPQAKAMDCANKEIGRLAQAQPLEPARQFARAFLAVGDARRTTRRAHVLRHDPRELEHQSLGLAAARPGQHHAVARRIVGRLLAWIASQIRRLGEIRRADAT